MHNSFIRLERASNSGVCALSIRILTSLMLLTTSVIASTSLGATLNDRFIPDRGEPSTKPPHGIRLIGPPMLKRPTDFRDAPSDPRAMRGSAGKPLGTSPSVTVKRPDFTAKSPVVNKVQVSAVNVSSPSVTGINHWWTYEEDAIPGGGRYMVNVGTGNLLVQYDDMDISNKGIDLAFRRTYNSASTHDYSNTDGSTPSNYGDGWTNTFDAHIAANSASGLSIYDTDGARYDYASNGAGGWTPPAGQYATLSWDGANGYFWTKKTGTVYYFYGPNQLASSAGLSGRLYQIIGRNHNNFIQFAYAFDNPNLPTAANLNTITATTEAGQAATLHFLDFTYGTAKFRLLGTLTWPDQTVVTYHYRAGTELAAVDEPSNNPAGTLRSQSFGWSANHIIYNASSPIYTASSGTNGGYIGFALSGGRVTQVSYHAVVNPTIADGTNSGVLQAGMATGMQQYKTVTYTTNLNNAETSVGDSDGHRIDYFWDASARVKYVHAWSGATTFLTSYNGWDAQNNLIATLDPRSSSSTDTTYRTDYAYDSNGNTIAVALPSISTSAGTLRPTSLYSYDSFNNITAYCDPVASHARNVDWTTQPSASDSLCAPVAGATRYTWMVPPPVSQGQKSYEPFGELTQTVTPLGYTHVFAYPAGSSDFGLPTSVSGTSFTQLDGTTRTPQQTFSYDSYGNIAAYDKGNGPYRLVYDSDNRLLTSSDPDGKASFHYYFVDGQTSGTETPQQHSYGDGDTFRYDLDGNLTQGTRHHGGVSGITQKYYDGIGRLVEVMQPQDTRTFPDLPGLPTYDYYSTPWITRYLYDLTKGSTVAYGATNFVAHGGLYKTQEYLPGGFIDLKGWSYDMLDRPTTSYGKAPGDATTRSTTNTYDSSGNAGLLGTVTDAISNVTTLGYDAAGHEVSVAFTSSPVTPSRNYSLDPDGRLASSATPQWGTEKYSYDADGRLTKKEEPSAVSSAAVLQYGYYPDGTKNSLSVSSSALSQANLMTYSYRPDGLSSSDAFAYNKQPFSWQYTSAGRLSTSGDPYYSAAETYSYDSFGQLSSFSVPIGTYSALAYTDEAELKSYTAFGVPHTNTYSARGELVSSSGGSASSGTRQQAANGAMFPWIWKVTNTPLRGDGVWETGTFIDQPTATILSKYFKFDADGIEQSVKFQFDAAGRQTGENPDGCTPVVRQYDAENHLVGDSRANPVNTIGCYPTVGLQATSTAYSWGPNGHVAKITRGSTAETLHWDGDTLLFTTNAAGEADDIKIGTLADYTMHDTSYNGLTVWDRDMSGEIIGAHNSTGRSGGCTPSPSRMGMISCSRPVGDTSFVGAAGFGWTSTQQYFGSSGLLFEYATDGFQDGWNTIQGVRSYNSLAQQWTTPDVYQGEIHDPASQKPYMYNRNNAVMYSDPNGYDTIVDPNPGPRPAQGISAGDAAGAKSLEGALTEMAQEAVAIVMSTMNGGNDLLKNGMDFLSGVASEINGALKSLHLDRSTDMRMTASNGTASGHNAAGNGLSITGSQYSAKISESVGRNINFANTIMSWKSSRGVSNAGSAFRSIRHETGIYSPPLPYTGGDRGFKFPDLILVGKDTRILPL